MQNRPAEIGGVGVMLARWELQVCLGQLLTLSLAPANGAQQQ